MKNADDYFKSGLRNNLKNYPAAVADYSKAIELDPFHYEAYLKRGTLRYKILKQYREALADLDIVIELKPDCAPAYLHRGVVKCNLRMFDSALPDFDRAEELDPNDERVYLNRGKSKYMLKYDEKEVRLDLEKAILFGSTAAADMLKLFYGADMDSARERITAGFQDNGPFHSRTAGRRIKNQENRSPLGRQFQITIIPRSQEF